MKQTLINRLIIGAFAGLATAGAYAGTIQSSSTAIAREVISSDSQAIISPSAAYRFSGDLDARSQDQFFQIQFILDSGALWGTIPGNNAISVLDSVTGTSTPANQGVDYNIVTVGKSADNKTLFVTIQVLSTGAAVKLIRQPLITVNTNSNIVNGAVVSPTSRGTITNLSTVAGSLVGDYQTAGGAGVLGCSSVKTSGISTKHYTALASPTTIADGSTNGKEQESLTGQNNLAGWLVFPTNLLPVVSNVATANARLTTGGSTAFTYTTPAQPAAVTGQQWISPTVSLLGSVKITQNSTTGYDADLSNPYLVAGTVASPGVTATTTAARPSTLTANDGGMVEANSIVVKVTANNGFASGGGIYLAKKQGDDGAATDCSDALGPVTSTAGSTATNSFVFASIPSTTAGLGLGATGARSVSICYSNNGSFIPSSTFTGVAYLVKAGQSAPTAANLYPKASPTTLPVEQTNMCGGNLASLGGAIKIDVRNYASSADTAANKWQSVIRIINPSDTTPADIWVQLINQDGKLGNFAKLTTLDVRQARNWTSAQIDACLAGTAAADGTYCTTGGQAATAAIGSAAPQNLAVGSPRIRITSTSGNTLRVQNYLYNPDSKNFIEASGNEAVDFAGSLDRAPANEGQYQYQDAQSGLNLSK